MIWRTLMPLSSWVLRSENRTFLRVTPSWTSSVRMTWHLMIMSTFLSWPRTVTANRHHRDISVSCMVPCQPTIAWWLYLQCMKGCSMLRSWSGMRWHYDMIIVKRIWRICMRGSQKGSQRIEKRSLLNVRRRYSVSPCASHTQGSRVRSIRSTLRTWFEEY